MDKSNLLRRAISTFACFVLCLCVFLLTVCSAIGIAFSEPFIKYVTEKSRYVSLSYSALKTNLEDIAIPSGLPTDFFEEKIDEELFKERTYNSFSANLSNKASDFTVEEIEKEFYGMLDEYALTQNRVISDEAEESLHGFAEECAKCYIRYVNPSSVKLILSNAYIVRKILLIGIIASAVLGLASGVFLFFLCKNKDFLKHICFALLGTSLLSGVIPSFLLFSKEVRKIAITAEALYSLTVTFFESLLTIAIIFAVVYLLLAIILLLIKFFITKKQIS